MTEKTITVNTALDARQAAFFVQTASKFSSRIQVLIGEKKINAKSIMGTISLGITEGQIATVVAEGADEEAAVKELSEVLAS